MRNFRGMKQDEISDIPNLVVVDAGQEERSKQQDTQGHCGQGLR